jgi:hypothetical protein
MEEKSCSWFKHKGHKEHKGFKNKDARCCASRMREKRSNNLRGLSFPALQESEDDRANPSKANVR